MGKPEQTASGDTPSISSPEEVNVAIDEKDEDEFDEHSVFSRKKYSSEKTSPEEHANLFSHLTFSWVNDIFRTSAKKRKVGEELESNDIWKSLPKDDANTLIKTWDEIWNRRLSEAIARKRMESKNLQDEDAWPEFTNKEAFWLFAGAMAEAFRKTLIVGFILRFITVAMYFTIPFLMNGLLQYIAQRSEKEVTEGALYVVGLIVAMILRVLIENAYYQVSVRMGWQIIGMFVTAIYQKSLRLSSSSRQQKTVGELVNILQLDTMALQWWSEAIQPLWSAPTQVIGYMVILYTFLGWSAFAGLGIVICSIPFTQLLFSRINKWTAQRIKKTDARVKVMNECLQGSLGVKMAAWEENFARKVLALRTAELAIYRKMNILMPVASAVVIATPTWTSVAAIVTFAYTGNDLDAPTIFTAIATFQQLEFPLGFLVFALTQTAQAMVSIQRIGNLMVMEEVTSGPSKGDSADGSVKIVNGEFSWATKKTDDSDSKKKKDKEQKKLEEEANEEAAQQSSTSVLKNINFHVQPQSLTAVIGPVGAGKSSLCSAIIGELHQKQGSIEVNGSIAYASQSPWILNATVRDNILFGEKFDSDRYWKVIQVCQLSHDLQVLDAGDMTMIGEKGINLSGGQKQRVSIARAAYSSKDIVILDDPLSALDPGVASKLFKHCICKFMGGKTRILITNQLNFLSSCDWVTVLATKERGLEDIKVEPSGVDEKADSEAAPQEEGTSADKLSPGFISEQGTFTELMKGDASFSSLVKKFELQQKEEQTESAGLENHQREASTVGVDVESIKQSLREKKVDKLMQTEERSRGSVKLAEYRGYIKSGGGSCVFFILIGLLSIQNAILVLSSAWVGVWARAEERSYITANESSPEFVETIFGEESLEIYANGYIVFGIALMFFAFLADAGFAVFGLRASKTLHNKLVNSVLNAPMSFYDTTPLGRIIARFATDITEMDDRLFKTQRQFFNQLIAGIGTLITISIATPLFLAFILPLAFAYRYILQLFRPVTRELQRIAAICRSPIFAHFSETVGGLSTIRSYGKVGLFAEQNIFRVNQYVETFSIQRSADRWLAIRLEMIGIMVTTAAAGLAVGGTVDASVAGLSLTYAVAITTLLNYGVRSFAYLENGMNAYARVQYYATQIEQEKPRSSDNPPAASWPSKGEIVLNNLRMRYRENTPLVLKGLSLTIPAGERVGVVGRTGSGKSSLMLCLLRLVEPVDAETSSPIVIDGVDISNIGLYELRKKISIVPQNPTIFSGTVRSNLDPFNEFSDSSIWSALEKCDLKSLVAQSPGKLEYPMSEFGENFSQGQRQLLCLARSLLNKAQILLLDEATSSVDFETDALIQKAIRSKTSFAGCTILTIAHRINTVIDNDKILVLDGGNVAEYDSPSTLLADSGSIFSQMANDRRSSHE